MYKMACTKWGECTKWRLQNVKSGVNMQNISSLIYFANFCYYIEKEPFTQCFGRFYHFSRTYEVAKFE